MCFILRHDERMNNSRRFCTEAAVMEAAGPRITQFRSQDNVANDALKENSAIQGLPLKNQRRNHHNLELYPSLQTVVAVWPVGKLTLADANMVRSVFYMHIKSAYSQLIVGSS